jgi:hypothetical protein
MSGRNRSLRENCPWRYRWPEQDEDNNEGLHASVAGVRHIIVGCLDLICARRRTLSERNQVSRERAHRNLADIG